MNNPHAHPASVVLGALEASPSGLSEEEARRRLIRDGANELPPPRRASPLRILVEQLRSVVVYLLVAATAISLALGEILEAGAIAAVLVINTTIGFVIEWRARRAMEAILSLVVARATVVRNGRPRIIEARKLVPGDVIELATGRQVPADARLLASTDLRTNEAALTGESLPVEKDAAAGLASDTVLADRATMVYSMTMVVAGVGRAVVTATGRSTEVGRIGELVSAVPFEPTPLERRLDALGHRLVWLALGVAALVAALGALQGQPLHLILETGIALAVAAVPEALPVVATIALAVGLRRMAARRALVRRLPAVESLGSTTVICTDKTKTLTSGEMAVARTWGPEREVLEAAALASRPETAGATRSRAADIDPVDRAVLDAAARHGIDRAALERDHPEAGIVPFSSERKFMAVFTRAGPSLALHVKGAPGRLIEASTRMAAETGEAPLDHAMRRRLIDVNDQLAGEGLRVLAVATGTASSPDEAAVRELTFLGFIGLADPPAAGVKETIAVLRAAGLRTVMLTGDQRLTAQAIGRELGILQPHEDVVEGRRLDAVDAAGLRELVSTAGAFSRITPEHKLRIVEALQQQGEIVAMLGDGVNDGPALRRADVGVAMGIRGTDVAKHAAAIVLQDDRFETVAAAVEEGRVIFDNIRKFVFYLFSCNVAEVLVLLIAGLAALPLPLLPLHLLWLNMITDTFPALALAMEPAESNVMHRPPRKPDEAILAPRFLLIILFYAGLITASTLAGYLWALAFAPAHATTMAFMTLAFAQIAHLGTARRAGTVLTSTAALGNRFALAAVAAAALLQLAAMFLPPVAQALQLTRLGAIEWVVVVAAALVPAVAGQTIKLLRGRR